MKKKSVLIRADPEFKELLDQLKHELSSDYEGISDRKITQMLSKRFKRNKVIEL